MSAGKKVTEYHMKSPTISRRHAGLMMLSTAMLAACVPQAQPRPQVTAIGGRIDLGVSSFDIITDYIGSQKPPYIGHLMMPSPAMQVAQWASDTLYPADQDGNALLTITNAAVTETELDGEEGVKGLFTNQQRLLIFVELEAVLSVSHPDGKKSATLNLISSAEKSIADDTTPIESDQIRVEAIREAIGRIDQELRHQLSGFNGQWPLYER